MPENMVLFITDAIRSPSRCASPPAQEGRLVAWRVMDLFPVE